MPQRMRNTQQLQRILSEFEVLDHSRAFFTMNFTFRSGSINYRGDLLFVCKTKTKVPQPVSAGSATKLNFLKSNSKLCQSDVVDFAAEIINGDSFHLAKSSLHFFTMESNEMRADDALTKTLKKDFMFFQGCAMEYKLKTDPQLDFLSMLEHNSNVAKKHGRSNVAMLWNLVKMVYKTAPSKRQHVNYLTTQNSNQSSSGLSGITRASGSFGTAGIGMVSSNGASITNIHPDGAGDHPVQGNFGGSSNDDLLDTSDQNGIITVPPKIAVPDLEVEVTRRNLSCYFCSAFFSL